MYKIGLPCAKGSESVLLEEANRQGLIDCISYPAFVVGKGSQEIAYRLCLWSRVASRVLLILSEFEITSVNELYEGVEKISWDDHISPDVTFAVHFTGTGQGIKNTQFGALKVKDAIVDRLRKTFKRRPDIDAKNPDIIIDVHLRKGLVILSLDISGGGLHQRGYRLSHGQAPLRETLAATLLYRAKWHEYSEKATLIDPMCGSGTLLIEASMMATNTAPAINRHQFGFEKWQNHRPVLWKMIFNEALELSKQGKNNFSHKIYGFDLDASLLLHARKNATIAGFDGLIHFEKRSVANFSYQRAYSGNGLIVCNPPYGERLGELTDLAPIYAELGSAFKQFPANWKLVVISSNEHLLKRMKLRSKQKYRVFNGALNSEIAIIERSNQPESMDEFSSTNTKQQISESAKMFANRILKNQNKLQKWAIKEGIDAYRIYDKDLPEYAFAIDRYGDYLLVQEYSPPKEIPIAKSQQRFFDVIEILPKVFSTPVKNIIHKVRQKQSGKEQYNKLSNTEIKLVVHEKEVKLIVNLTDYLDTGLFLDHRPMRQKIAEEIKGKTFLNLFCYTASVSVHAALGGAFYSTSVDLSQTYLDWASENFELNNLNKRHRLVKADVMQWLKKGNDKYDVIFCDPPTFSNTKKEDRVFDIQRDHIVLIDLCMKRLVSHGTLYFSNNYRGFKMDPLLAEKYTLQDISPKTIDLDFKRNPKIHKVWCIQHKDNEIKGDPRLA